MTDFSASLAVEISETERASMLIRLLLAFIIIPFVELVLLLQMAEATSWWVTLAIVIGTGVLGSVLARREGLAALARFREAIAAGRMPGREIQDGMMIAVAAALLLTPGLISDSLGFLLLTPWGRRRVGDFLRRRYAGRFRIHPGGFEHRPAPDMEHDVEQDRERPRPMPHRNSSGGFTIDSPHYGPKRKQVG